MRSVIGNLCRPFGAYDRVIDAVPGACAPGYILSPLRGCKEIETVDSLDAIWCSEASFDE